MEGPPHTPTAMEDIMASIKRIIAEPPAAPPPPGRDEPEVLELGGDDRAAPESPRARWDVEPTLTTVAPAPAVNSPPLVSTAARQASQRAMAALAGVTIDPAASTNTLDGLVREMLRPMLKDWLDANLPDLVERVVVREVARLSGH
jgi:uncharacterized protein